ncbi:uncharacterized protein LOC111116732 [Crassostrea virginica]
MASLRLCIVLLIVTSFLVLNHVEGHLGGAEGPPRGPNVFMGNPSISEDRREGTYFPGGPIRRPRPRPKGGSW